MRRLLVLALVPALLLAALAHPGRVGADTVYVAHLTGDQEVPPRDTGAQGQLVLRLNEDGTALEYRLVAANIENVVGAHLHLAPATENGQIVVHLFNGAPGGGRFAGVLAEGTITAADLTGPLAGQPLSALVAAIEAGNIYVNVHTNDGVGATNTGPGDFPGGEIRAQLG